MCLPSSPLRVTAAFGLVCGVFLARPAVAVDVLAISDLSTRADADPITFPIYDPTFPAWAKPKVSAEVGRVVSVVPTDGVAMVTWQPPEGYPGGTVSLRVRFKDAGGTKQDTTVSIDVPASPRAPIVVEATPPVAAPDTTTVQLRWTPPPSGQAPETRRFRIATSFGTVGPVTVDASGVATATWRRPASVDVPTMALVTLVDAADPRRRGRLELPVQVAQSTTFTVPPDAKVSVQLGDETIGPQQASPAGTVAFDLRLDPRVTEGRLTGRTPHGDSVDQVVALPNTSSPAVLFAPVPSAAAAGTGQVPLAVSTWSPPGTDPVDLQTRATAGTLKLDTDTGDGWVVGRWRTAGSTGPATVEAELGPVEASVPVEVAPGLARVVAEVSPTQLSASQRDVTVTARALGADNAELADTVGVRAARGTVSVRPTRRGTLTTAKVRRDRDAEHVAILVEPPGSVADRPVAAVVPWLVPVGHDQVLLRVAAVDPLGRAVASVPLTLSPVGPAPSGLPPTLTTDGYGMAEVLLDAPDSPFGLTVAGAGHRGGAALTAGRTAIVGGDPTWTTTHGRWVAAAPTLVVGPPAEVVAAVVPPPAAPGPASPGPSTQAEPPPSAEPARPSSPKPSASGRAWLRGAVAFAGSAYAVESTQTDATVGPLGSTVADDGLNQGGLQAFVLAFPGDGAWGFEVDGRLIQGDITAEQTYAATAIDPSTTDPDALADASATTASTAYETTAWDLRVGARYRAALAGPLSGYGLLQLHRQSVGLFLWDDGEAVVSDTPLLGARLGAGVLVEAGPAWLDLHAAETFAPFPIRHELEARVHLNILPAVAIHLGGGQTWRSMAFEIDGAELDYTDSTTHFAVGLGTALR